MRGRKRLIAFDRLPAVDYRRQSVKLRTVKCTQYFLAIRNRPDRAIIRDKWIKLAMSAPVREELQADGRIRRWARIQEMEGRYLRVVLLEDGETVHNAFFDRNFEP